MIGSTNLLKSRSSTFFSSLFKEGVVSEVGKLEDYEKPGQQKATSVEKWTERSTAEQEVLDYLQQRGWKINNRVKVESFLKEHSTVVEVLKETPDIIEEYFEEADLVLELFQSREEDYEELFLDIFTDLEVDSALEKLDKIDQNWLIPEVNKKTTNFNLDVSFNK